MANEKKSNNAGTDTEQQADEAKVALLAAGVTQEQLDEWKAKYKEVHIIQVKLSENETLTGYFKKPNRDIMAHCVNLSQDKKIYEAREFLLNNTWIGGDKAITTNFDAAIVAQTRLWSNLNFLTAEATKY